MLKGEQRLRVPIQAGHRPRGIPIERASVAHTWKWLRPWKEAWLEQGKTPIVGKGQAVGYEALTHHKVTIYPAESRRVSSGQKPT